MHLSDHTRCSRIHSFCVLFYTFKTSLLFFVKKHCHKVIIKMFTAARLPVSSTALSYLAEKFHQSSAVEAHQRLRSASSSSLVVRRTCLSTIGDGAFAGRCFPTVEHSAVCPRRTSRRRRHWLFLRVAWRLISSIVPFPATVIITMTSTFIWRKTEYPHMRS